MLMESSTAPPMGETAMDARDNSKETNSEPSTESEQEQAPAPAPAPKKTWSLPKAPPPSSVKDAPKKKTLLEIMEEEQRKEKEAQAAKQKQLESRLLQEEEAALMQAMQASMATETNADGMDEDMRLALMLSMQDQPQSEESAPNTAAAATVTPVAAAASAAVATAAADPSEDDGNNLTEEELKEIEKALAEADALESAKTDAASLKLALELQSEEDGKVKAKQQRGPQGNVRTMHRSDFLREKGESGEFDMDYPVDEPYIDPGYDLDEDGAVEEGFRINSAKKSSWSRVDRGIVIGPNQELRTKHDPKLQGQANAYRLELRADDTTSGVSNKAYNGFKAKMQKKFVKGVAAHGHGRSTADVDKTREGALDGRVRLQIARAVNNGLIEAFYGCVKEGKEAEVFHASQGVNSEGFDVAVKVFKRISEFRNRGQYVVGDPRYGDGKDFRFAGGRQQVEIWTEKENRNLIRAYRAKVPVPRPLWQKENVLFMRFLGEEGWPAPQLREVDIKKGSRKWTTLYEQAMEAMQLLYCDAKLVHGDLSEYNIMVCPEKFLERFDDEGGKTEESEQAGDGEEKKPAATSAEDSNSKMPAESAENTDEKMPASNESGEAKPAEQAPSGDSLHIALIDFGQAVDLRHPDAEELLERDVTRVKQFFDKMGIETVSVEAATAYVKTKGAALR